MISFISVGVVFPKRPLYNPSPLTSPLATLSKSSEEERKREWHLQKQKLAAIVSVRALTQVVKAFVAKVALEATAEACVYKKGSCRKYYQPLLMSLYTCEKQAEPNPGSRDRLSQEPDRKGDSL